MLLDNWRNGKLNSRKRAECTELSIDKDAATFDWDIKIWEYRLIEILCYSGLQKFEPHSKMIELSVRVKYWLKDHWSFPLNPWVAPWIIIVVNIKTIQSECFAHKPCSFRRLVVGKRQFWELSPCILNGSCPNPLLVPFFATSGAASSAIRTKSRQLHLKI